MTVKKIVFTLTLFMFFIQVNGQSNLNYGVKAGVNFTGFHTGSSAFTDNFGVSFGGVALVELNDQFSLQGELLYNQKGGKIGELNSEDLPFNIDAKFSYIDLPITIKWYFLEKMSLDIGPQIGILVSDTSEIIDSDQGLNGEDVDFENTNSIDFTVNGGLSYQFNQNFFLRLRYSYGLSKVISSERYKNSGVSLSLGYFIK